MLLVLGQDRPQMRPVQDQVPVEDLTAQGADRLIAALRVKVLYWLPSMKGSVKGMAPALLRVWRRWSVSTSFVRLGAPR